jgi:hypothetical protein
MHVIPPYPVSDGTRIPLPPHVQWQAKGEGDVQGVEKGVFKRKIGSAKVFLEENRFCLAFVAFILIACLGLASSNFQLNYS